MKFKERYLWWLLGAAFVAVWLTGCSQQSTDVQRPEWKLLEPRTEIYGYAVYETTIDGCQYIAYNDHFSHKGNCTNEVHRR